MLEPEFDAWADTYHRDHATSIATSGEQPDFFAAYKISKLQTLTRRMGLRDATILDFGAGIGNSLPHMRASFPASDIVCADVSARSLELLEARHPGLARTALITNGVIPVDSNSCDIVFTACVFHHIDPAAHSAAFDEILRVLKPGGHAVLFEHNPWNPLTRRAVRNCPFDENAILISGPEMRRRFANAGFRRARLDYVMFFPHALARLRPFERGMTRLPAGAQYMIHAQKKDR